MNSQNQPVEPAQPISGNPSKTNWFFWLKTFLRANKTMIIAVAVVAAISFGSTAYLLFSPNNKKVTKITTAVQNIPEFLPTSTLAPTITVEPTQKVRLTPTPTIDPTASWSAYTHSKYGYSIKYPKDWTATNAGQLEPKIPDYVIFNPKSASSSARSVTISYSTRTYDESMAIGAQNSETIKVGTVSGAKKIEQDSQKKEMIHIILPQKNKTNSLVIYAKRAYEDVFTQMLTTLKFL